MVTVKLTSYTALRVNLSVKHTSLLTTTSCKNMGKSNERISKLVNS